MSYMADKRQHPSNYPRTNPVSGIVTEASWQQTVKEAAEMFGWWVYHTHDSRHSQPGFPDLVLIKPPRVMFIELKRETGQLTIEQRYVMDMLGECSEIETHIARPSNWSQVVEWLS